MALGSYETVLGWLGSENRKSSIRVFFDYKQLCTSKLDLDSTAREVPCVTTHRRQQDHVIHTHACIHTVPQYLVNPFLMTSYRSNGMLLVAARAVVSKRQFRSERKARGLEQRYRDG